MAHPARWDEEHVRGVTIGDQFGTVHDTNHYVGEVLLDGVGES